MSCAGPLDGAALSVLNRAQVAGFMMAAPP